MDRPVVVLQECWECGRISIYHIPAGLDRREVQRALHAALERRGEYWARSEPPPPLDQGLPYRFVVARRRYCGC